MSVERSYIRAKVIGDVIAERERQIDHEGWTTDQDDANSPGGLARAASCYAYAAGVSAINRKMMAGKPSSIWPWSAHWWKPTTPRRDLIKAAALIVAEIERLDRAEQKTES